MPAIKNKRDLLETIKDELSKRESKLLAIRDATSILDRMKEIKGDQGEKGEKGDIPVKGVDYFTPEDIAEVAEQAAPTKGVHYFDGVDGIDGKDGVDGVDGKHGKHGKDGSPDTAEQIAEKINSLEGSIDHKVLRGAPSPLQVSEVIKELKKTKALEMRDIKNMPLNMNDLRWHGGGLSTVSHDSTLTGDGTPANPLSVVGGGAVAETLLSTTAGIDMTAIGVTPLYTVPLGLTAAISKALIVITTANTDTVEAFAGIGIAAGESDIFTQTDLTGLLGTNNFYHFNTTGISALGFATNIINFGVSVGATAITQTATVYLFGFTF